MISSSNLFKMIHADGSPTGADLLQAISFDDSNSKLVSLTFHYRFRAPKVRAAQKVDFRLSQLDTNDLLSRLNGTISVGFQPTSASYQTIDAAGTVTGKLTVGAHLVTQATPNISPVNFQFAFTPKAKPPMPPIIFDVSHVDATFVAGLINGVANTN